MGVDLPTAVSGVEPDPDAVGFLGSFKADFNVDALRFFLSEIWPKVRIIFRGDSGFCRWRMLSWCERHGVDYIVGIAKNKRLNRVTAPIREDAEACF